MHNKLSYIIWYKHLIGFNDFRLSGGNDQRRKNIAKSRLQKKKHSKFTVLLRSSALKQIFRFQRKYLIIFKIIIDDKVVKQVSDINFL